MIARRRLKIGVCGSMIVVAAAALVLDRLRPLNKRLAVEMAWWSLRKHAPDDLKWHRMVTPDDCDCAVSSAEPAPSRTIGNLWFPGREHREWQVLIAARGTGRVQFRVGIVDRTLAPAEISIATARDDEIGHYLAPARRMDCRTLERRPSP